MFASTPEHCVCIGFIWKNDEKKVCFLCLFRGCIWLAILLLLLLSRSRDWIMDAISVLVLPLLAHPLTPHVVSFSQMSPPPHSFPPYLPVGLTNRFCFVARAGR